MIKRKHFLSAAIMLVLAGGISPVAAQDKMLSMQEAILSGARLMPKNMSAMSWRPGTHEFTYWEDKKIMLADAGKAGSAIFLTEDKVKEAFVKAGATLSAPLASFHWVDKDRMLIQQSENGATVWYLYNTAGNSVEKISALPAKAEYAEMEETGFATAYTIDNNLYITLKGGEQLQVSNDADKGIVNGQAAHRREFGIEKGTFWSPKGNYLAWYRMDERKVTDYPLIDNSQRPAAANMIKYPMAGMTSHEVTVGVYDLKAKRAIFLQTEGPKDQYLTNISWSPDEKDIYVAVLNREQNHMWLNKYDATTGKFVKTLFEETHDKYVEPLDPLFFVNKNPKQFVFFSQRDGYKHPYLYNTDGKLIRKLGEGEWVITEMQGFDEKGERMFVTATVPGSLGRDQQTYAITLKNGKMRSLTPDAGLHATLLSKDGGFLIDRYSSTSVPRVINVVNTGKGKVVRNLLTAENPLKDYKLGETRLFSIKADDGTPLSCRMILPPGFDENKKYPVVVYVYGGPHAQMINGGWLGGSNLWMQLMAQKGYIMFTVDNRGSGNRGMAFEQATFRNLGTTELKDQLKGVEYLRSLRYVDTARLGVHGWSFGGFMTTSLMTRYPGTFKVAVAGGPVIDWSYYEIMYTERYMDTPQENPQGYDESNLLNHAKNLQGRLMLIHGTADDVVVWQHSLMFLKKCVDLGKQLDYFVYPGHQHNVLGKDRVHLMDKVTLYFDDFLKK